MSPRRGLASRLAALSVLAIIIVSALTVALVKLPDSGEERALRVVSEILEIGVYPVGDFINGRVYAGGRLESWASTFLQNVSELLERVSGLVGSSGGGAVAGMVEDARGSLERALEELSRGNVAGALAHAKVAYVGARHAEIYWLLSSGEANVSEVFGMLAEEAAALRDVYGRLLGEYSAYSGGLLDSGLSVILAYELEAKLVSAESLIGRVEELASRGAPAGLGNESALLDLASGMAGNLALARYNLGVAQALLERLEEIRGGGGPGVEEAYDRVREFFSREAARAEGMAEEGTLARGLLDKAMGLASVADNMKARGYSVYPLVRLIEALAYVETVIEYRDSYNVPAVNASNETLGQSVSLDDLRKLLEAKREAAEALNSTVEALVNPRDGGSGQDPLWGIALLLLSISEGKIAGADEGLSYFKENPLEDMTLYHFLTILYAYTEARDYTMEVSSLQSLLQQLMQATG